VKPATLSVPEVLDETGDLVSRLVAPWAGVLWLACLPLRLLQVEFAASLMALGSDASRHGQLLLGLASASAAAFVLATFGRAVFSRACLLAMRTGASPGPRALAVGLTPFLTHLYLASIAEVLFFALGLTIVMAPLAITLSALAAVVAPLSERPGLVGPLKLVSASGARAGTLVGLQLVFLVGFAIAFANVAAAFLAGLWLAGAVPGVDIASWAHRLSAGPRFMLLVWAGATLVIEPFWLAAHSAYVHRLRARESGEDLRAWFERLRAPEAA
jgi:hypothetical protein